MSRSKEVTSLTWCEVGVCWEMLRLLETKDRGADPQVRSLTAQVGLDSLCLATTLLDSSPAAHSPDTSAVLPRPGGLGRSCC